MATIYGVLEENFSVKMERRYENLFLYIPL